MFYFMAVNFARNLLVFRLMYHQNVLVTLIKCNFNPSLSILCFLLKFRWASIQFVRDHLPYLTNTEYTSVHFSWKSQGHNGSWPNAYQKSGKHCKFNVLISGKKFFWRRSRRQFYNVSSNSVNKPLFNSAGKVQRFPNQRRLSVYGINRLWISTELDQFW